MNCRHCRTSLEATFVDLGAAPPSNAYLTKESLERPETTFPLKVKVCTNCWLVQTEDYAHFADLFDEDYAYFSSLSKSWLNHSKNYVRQMINRFGLTSDSLVADVAANDGYLLQYFQENAIPCYGVEPTAPSARVARAKGLEIIEEFFGVELGLELVKQYKQVALVAANNVLAHVPDINDFVCGFQKVLKKNGVATFEFPHLLELVTNNQFDTIYHEHFSYLSLIAVKQIFEANDLSIFDVEQLSSHGGSLRVFVQRSDTKPFEISTKVAEIVDLETDAGVSGEDFYAGFQTKAELIKDDFVAFLIEAKKSGASIGAYGAAAKGNTLMNFAGVRPDLIPYVVDLNSEKQGKFMPGSRIPIVNEDHLKRDQPDLVVILPWNLKTEIMKQLSYIRDWGGQFVVAVPELSVE